LRVLHASLVEDVDPTPTASAAVKACEARNADLVCSPPLYCAATVAFRDEYIQGAEDCLDRPTCADINTCLAGYIWWVCLWV
jgi:hypothetical protein